MDSLISEQTWYLQSSARDDQEPINNFVVNNLSRLIRVNAGQTLKIYLVSFNGLNSFYNISNQNNTFYLNGVAKQLSIGFYTNFTDICTNIKNALGTALTVTTQAFTNKGVWTFAAGTPFTIQFPFGRNSHALMGIPFNFGNPYTITPTLVSGVWTYVTPSPMMYNYIQNINLRADGFPTPQNIEFLNNEGNDGALNYSTLFAKIPVTADPYQNIWFNPQDVEQYVSLSIGKNSGIERVNFQLTDDFQNLLQCDYDWEAVFKVEVYQDILIPTLNKGMGTNQVDDSSYLKNIQGGIGNVNNSIGNVNNSINAGLIHTGTGLLSSDTPYLSEISDKMNNRSVEVSVTRGTFASIDTSILAAGATVAGAVGVAIAANGTALATALGATTTAAEVISSAQIGALEAAATEISGAITAAIETATAELVAVGEQEVAAEEELVAVEEDKAVTKAKTWAETLKDTVTTIKYIEDIAIEAKNAIQSLKNIGEDLIGIKDDAKVAADKAAAEAKIVHDEYRADVSDFKTKFDSLIDKLDLENIDLSKLDIDLSKLDIDLAELKNITAAIENKEIDMSPISDELEKISNTMDESRDILSNVAVTIDDSRDILSNVAVTIDESRDIFSNVAVTIDESVDIFKKDMNIFDIIGKNFAALVKHLTGQHGTKESYETQIDELKKFIEESKEKNIKSEVKTWISENKDIKYDPETSDKTSYNKLISTAISLEQKIKYEPFEAWIEKHREKA